MPLGPLDLTGFPFLMLYIGLLACAAIAGEAIPRLLRPAGRRQEVHDPEQLAALTGGATRLAETAVTRLLATDALTMVARGLFAPAAGATGATAVERAVLAGTLPARWSTMEERVQPHAAVIQRGLVAAGLMMNDARAARLRTWRTAPYCLLLCLGAARLVVGLARNRPVGYLAFLLFLTIIATVVRWRSVDRRTRAGRAAVFLARERSARLRGAPTRAEASTAVALFGTTVLLGSGLAAFHQARAAPANDGGSGGGDGGGGGCGGGGCGGCGG